MGRWVIGKTENWSGKEGSDSRGGSGSGIGFCCIERRVNGSNCGISGSDKGFINGGRDVCSITGRGNSIFALVGRGPSSSDREDCGFGSEDSDSGKIDGSSSSGESDISVKGVIIIKTCACGVGKGGRGGVDGGGGGIGGNSVLKSGVISNWFSLWS